MLRWRELHPYNAVHVVALDPVLEPPASLDRAIAQALEHWGLTGLVVDARRGRYEYRGGAARPTVRRASAMSLLAGIEREVEHELNAPFGRTGALDPFRFFVVEAPDGRALGLAYDHFIAGGDCILALLHAIVTRAAGADETGPRPALYPPTQARLFLRNLPRLLAGLARLPAHIASARATVRPRYRDARDGYNAYSLFHLSPAQTAHLIATSKAWSVTVNDMLLALLLAALDPLAPSRHAASRRRNLAVASIMNLRGELGEVGEAAFGQFLGSLRVAHPVPAHASLESIARDVHAETTRVKSRKLYLQALAAMRYVAWVWPLLKPAQRARFYAKSYPIWAGLSALNVNAMWDRPAGAVPPLYIRGVPTGPLAPVVLAVTTVGDTLHAGLSFRTAAFSRDDVQQLWAGLVRRLETT
jgi:hypothetical protein